MRKFKPPVKWSKFTRRLNNLSQNMMQTQTIENIELYATDYVLVDRDGKFAKFTDGQIAVFGDKDEAGEQGIEFEIVSCSDLSAEKQTELKLNIIGFSEKENQ